MKGQCVAGCGACCDPIVLPYGPFDIATSNREELVWMRNNTTHMPAREGKPRYLAHLAHPDQVLIAEDGESVNMFFYRCHHYDEERRVCTAYDTRPDMCRDYPWHGESPDSAKALPKTCGFLVDVGIEPVPVEINPARRSS